MPNVWTHIDFAETVIGHVVWTPQTENEKAYLRLGAQGPDPFFYHRFWPWIKEKPAVNVGNRMHNEKCGPLLMDMVQYVREQKNNTVLQAYVLGFITHHLLDRNAHPYVNYHSGPEGRKHQELEFAIDTMWMEEKRSITTWKSSAHKMIDVGTHLDQGVSLLLETLINNHFPELSTDLPDGYADESYRDMVKATKVLFKFAGRKSRWLPSDVSALVFKPINPDIDYLNRNKKEWIDPTDQEQKYTKSFDELFEDAEDEAHNILPLVLQYWETGEDNILEELTEKISNLSYSTGKHLDLKRENQFFEPIL